MNPFSIHSIACCTSPVKSLLANGFIVKTWVFASQGHSGLADYPFVNLCPSVGSYVSKTNYVWAGSPDVEYLTGTPGQNNTKPASFFNCHFMIRSDITGKYYDPSYGIIYLTEQDFDNGLSGYWLYRYSGDFVFRKNPEDSQIQFVEFKRQKKQSASAYFVMFP